MLPQEFNEFRLKWALKGLRNRFYRRVYFRYGINITMLKSNLYVDDLCRRNLTNKIVWSTFRVFRKMIKYRII